MFTLHGGWVDPWDHPDLLPPPYALGVRDCVFSNKHYHVKFFLELVPIHQAQLQIDGNNTLYNLRTCPQYKFYLIFSFGVISEM